MKTNTLEKRRQQIVGDECEVWHQYEFKVRLCHSLAVGFEAGDINFGSSCFLHC